MEAHIFAFVFLIIGPECSFFPCVQLTSFYHKMLSWHKPNVLHFKFHGLKDDFVHNVADGYYDQAAAIWMSSGSKDKKRG